MSAKRTKLFFLPAAIISFLMICSFISDQESAETFARDLFSTIRSGDSVSFQKCFITAKEFAMVVDSSTWSDEKKAKTKAKLSQHFLDSASAAVFTKLHKDQDNNAVSFSAAKIDSMNCRIQPKEGMTAMSMDIYFNYSKNTYRLSGYKILKTIDGWKMGNGLSLFRCTNNK